MGTGATSICPLPPRPGHPSSQVPPRTPPPAAPSQHPASPLRAATSSQTSAESATIRGCGAPTLPPEGPTEQALAPLRASEGRRTCPLSGPRRGGCSRAGQRGAPGRTAPRSPRSAPSQPGAPASYVSRPRPDVGRYRRPDAARRGPTPTRPRRARCADPVRPSRPLASACRGGQPLNWRFCSPTPPKARRGARMLEHSRPVRAAGWVPRGCAGVCGTRRGGGGRQGGCHRET